MDKAVFISFYCFLIILKMIVFMGFLEGSLDFGCTTQHMLYIIIQVITLSLSSLSLNCVCIWVCNYPPHYSSFLNCPHSLEKWQELFITNSYSTQLKQQQTEHCNSNLHFTSFHADNYPKHRFKILFPDSSAMQC